MHRSHWHYNPDSVLQSVMTFCSMCRFEITVKNICKVGLCMCDKTDFTVGQDLESPVV